MTDDAAGSPWTPPPGSPAPGSAPAPTGAAPPGGAPPAPGPATPPYGWGHAPPPSGYGAPPGQYPQGQYPPGQYPPAQHPGYAYQPPQYAPGTGPTNGLAIASLVCGILWIYWVGSVLAVVFGLVAKRQIRERGETGNGLATAGIVLGFIGIGVFALFMAFAVLVAVSGSSSF